MFKRTYPIVDPQDASPARLIPGGALPEPSGAVRRAWEARLVSITILAEIEPRSGSSILTFPRTFANLVVEALAPSQYTSYSRQIRLWWLLILQQGISKQKAIGNVRLLGWAFQCASGSSHTYDTMKKRYLQRTRRDQPYSNRMNLYYWQILF
jgi:hypothetical protein